MARLNHSFEWYTSFGLPSVKCVQLVAGALPSAAYDRWIGSHSDLFPFVGRSYRFNGVKRPPLQPDYVKEFVVNHSHDFDPFSYRYVVPSIDSSYLSLSHYAKSQPLVYEDDWILASQWLQQTYMPFMAGSRLASWEYVRDYADKATSCGFYWRDHFPTKGAFLKSSISQLVLDSYWLRLVDDPVLSIWQVSDKYEMRSSEKLDHVPPHIRTFLVGPIEYVLSMNRFCLHANDLFYRSAVRTPSAVGRTKFLGGFQAFYSCVVSRFQFSVGFAFDFSKYDMSMFVKLFMTICEFRLSCLHPDDCTPDNVRRLRVLYTNMLNCVVWTVLGEFLFKTTGNNSGQPNTLPDNTIAQTLLWYYVFLRLWRSQHVVVPLPDLNYTDPRSRELSSSLASQVLPSLEDFARAVSPLYCGDDSIMGVSDEVLSWFNVNTISSQFDTIGMKVTCDTPVPKQLSLLDFLSHDFVQLPGSSVYLPAPRTNKVMCSLYVSNGSPDPRWVLMRAFALRIESWANLRCRALLSEFIVLTMLHFRSELVGSLQIPSAPHLSITWASILSSYLSDDVLRRLYYGLEGALNVRSLPAFKLIDVSLLELPFATLFL